jgi:hypothetical protein
MSNPDRLSPVINGIKDQMSAQMAVSQAEIVDFETRTRGVLEGETGVNPYQVGQYLNFSRAIYRLRNKEIEGSPLIDAVAIQVAKFKSQGLTEAILNKIRTEVWTIPAPAGP